MQLGRTQGGLSDSQSDAQSLEIESQIDTVNDNVADKTDGRCQLSLRGQAVSSVRVFRDVEWIETVSSGVGVEWKEWIPPWKEQVVEVSLLLSDALGHQDKRVMRGRTEIVQEDLD